MTDEKTARAATDVAEMHISVEYRETEFHLKMGLVPAAQLRPYSLEHVYAVPTCCANVFEHAADQRSAVSMHEHLEHQ